MTLADEFAKDADRVRNACAWLLAQWISDTDGEWRDHVLDGLRREDPDLFAVLDDLTREDEGRGLLDHLPSAPVLLAGSSSGTGGRLGSPAGAATIDGGSAHTQASPASGDDQRTRPRESSPAVDLDTYNRLIGDLTEKRYALWRQTHGGEAS